MLSKNDFNDSELDIVCKCCGFTAEWCSCDEDV